MKALANPADKTVTLDLTAIAHGGEALGRHEGKVVFVPYTIPGEKVRARIVKESARWARAELVDVLEPSPDRVEPPCPYYGPGGCGGCQWQHIGYQRQLDLKTEIVRDQLQRLGRVSEPPVLPCLAAQEPWGYRNHLQYAPDEDGRLGFRKAGSREVIPVDQCLLGHPLLQDLRETLDLDLPDLVRLSLRAGTTTGDQMVVLELEGEDAPELELDLAASAVLLRRRKPPLVLVGSGHLDETIGGRRYRISAGSFFQVHTAMAEKLLSLVLEYLQPEPEDVLLDGYCGVGLFGLALAPKVAQVIGIEGAPTAVVDFIWNAESMALENATLIEASVEEALHTWSGTVGSAGSQPESDSPEFFLAGVDLAIVDPPRSGMGAATVSNLSSLSPRRVVYVSCDPATLARDAQSFLESGYRLREVQPVDMFPQTFHVESVALWVKQE